MLRDPDQLRLCALIRRHGSLGGAAAELGLTSAAVSAQLSRAERDWGTRLVDRGPRGASLTPLGQLLADAGDEILATTDVVDQLFREHAGQAARRLRIATFQTMAEYLLPPALTALRHRRPDVELSLVDATSTTALTLIRDRSVDIAIVADYPEHRSPERPNRKRHATAPLVWTRLLVDPLVICLPDDHPLALDKKLSSLALPRAHAEPWIVVNAGQPARAQFDAATQKAGFDPRVVFETDSYSTAQALVGSGIGIAAISRSTIRPTPGAMHLQLTKPRMSRHIYAVTRSGSVSEGLTKQFVTLLADVANELTATA